MKIIKIFAYESVEMNWDSGKTYLRPKKAMFINSDKISKFEDVNVEVRKGSAAYSDYFVAEDGGEKKNFVKLYTAFDNEPLYVESITGDELMKEINK